MLAAGSGQQKRRDYPPAPEPLPVPVMDNHTHLDFPDGDSPVAIAAALDAAEAVGVQGAVQVGYGPGVFPVHGPGR